MRKTRIPGKTHETDFLSRTHEFADLHCDAAFAQMRVLDFPAAPLVDHDRVARLAAGDGCLAYRAHVDVVHAVALRAHSSWRRGKYGDTSPHGRDIRQAYVRALVPVVTEVAASIIARAAAGIVVDVILHHARGADPAVEREGELHRVGLRRARPGQRHRRCLQQQHANSSHRACPVPANVECVHWIWHSEEESNVRPGGGTVLRSWRLPELAAWLYDELMAQMPAFRRNLTSPAMTHLIQAIELV